MRSRAVVDIEKNGVVAIGFNAPDDLRNIFGENGNSPIVEQRAVDLHQEFAIPIDYFRQQFRHMHFRFLSHTPKHGFE